MASATPNGSLEPVITAELYDPVNDRWTPATPLNFARYSHNAVLLPADTNHPSGQVLVMGGYGISVGVGVVLGSYELYDPANGAGGTWTTQSQTFRTPRSIFTSTLIVPCATQAPNRCVLSAGGSDNVFNVNSNSSSAFYTTELYTW
jgi:hypothetical protein